MKHFDFLKKSIVIFCLYLLGMLRAEADGILIDGFYYNLDKASKPQNLFLISPCTATIDTVPRIQRMTGLWHHRKCTMRTSDVKQDNYQ